jgi:ABC-2 type transport system permease protein
MILGVGAFYTALTIAAFAMSDPSEAKESLQLPSIFDNGMQIATIVGYILTVVLASGLIGNEYSWNTIRPLLARARSRSALLSAKWITVLLYSVGLFLVGLLATIAFSAGASAIVGNFEGADAELIGEWVVSFGRVLIGQLPYVALAFCLALITRSNAVGIAVGIGVGFLEPAIWGLLGLVTDAFDTVRKFGLEYPSTLLFNMNTGMEDITTNEAWGAAATLGGWIVLFVALTYYFFNKRDVTSG